MSVYLTSFVTTSRGSGLSRFTTALVDSLDEWGMVDLRPDATVVDGRCFVGSPADVSPRAAEGLKLGDTLDDTLGPLLRTRIGNALGLTVQDATVRDLIATVMLLESREDGTRWKAPRRDASGETRIVLNGELVQAVRSVKGGATFTESFNKANSTTLGPDLTWTETHGNAEVLSNEWHPVTVGDYTRSRADSDVGSADMYAQASLTLWGRVGGGYVLGTVCARYASAADTCYSFGWEEDSAPRRKFMKCVAGADTELASSSGVSVPSTPATIKITVSGSSLEGFVNGVSVATLTDSSITTGQRGGIWSMRNISGDNITWDSFETGSLGGAAATSLAMRRRRPPFALLRGGF